MDSQSGYHNIDALPLGKLLQYKQKKGVSSQGKGLIRRLLKKGFK